VAVEGGVVLGDVEVDGDSVDINCFSANLSTLLQRTAAEVHTLRQCATPVGSPDEAEGS
jgi:hypothetical protein